jgi:hypothetical protein
VLDYFIQCINTKIVSLLLFNYIIFARQIFDFQRGGKMSQFYDNGLLSVFVYIFVYTCMLFLYRHFNNKMAYFNSHLVLSLYRKSNIAEVCQRRGDKNDVLRSSPFQYETVISLFIKQG